MRHTTAVMAVCGCLLGACNGDERVVLPSAKLPEGVALITDRDCYEPGGQAVVGMAGDTKRFVLGGVFFLDRRLSDDSWHRQYTLDPKDNFGEAEWRVYDESVHDGDDRGYSAERLYTLRIPDEAAPGRYRVVPDEHEIPAAIEIAESCRTLTTRTLPSYTTTTGPPATAPTS